MNHLSWATSAEASVLVIAPLGWTGSGQNSRPTSRAGSPLARFRGRAHKSGVLVMQEPRTWRLQRACLTRTSALFEGRQLSARGGVGNFAEGSNKTGASATGGSGAGGTLF